MPLLLLMIFVMPFEQSPYLLISPTFLGIFPDFTVIKLLGLLGFTWAMLRLMSGDRAILGLGSRQAKLFFALYAGVVVSGIWNGTGYLALSRLFALMTFLPFVLVAVKTEDDVRRVLYALALAPVVAFPYGLRQMVRFDSRMGSGLYEPNYLAANLLLVIPLAFAIASQQPTRTRKRLWIGAGVALVTMLFLTASRGGFLGLLVIAMVVAYRYRGVAGALLAVIGLALVALPTDLGGRALATLADDTEAPWGLEQSNRAHVALFWAGLRMIAENPLFGVGPSNFKPVSQLYTGLDQAAIAHNSYLELGAEMGLPVLVIFLVLLATVFGAFRRARGAAGEGQERLAAWSQGLSDGMIGFLVAAFFISAEYEKFLWLVIFLSIVVARLTQRSAEREPREAPEQALATWR